MILRQAATVGRWLRRRWWGDASTTVVDLARRDIAHSLGDRPRLVVVLERSL